MWPYAQFCVVHKKYTQPASATPAPPMLSPHMAQIRIPVFCFDESVCHKACQVLENAILSALNARSDTPLYQSKVVFLLTVNRGSKASIHPVIEI